MKIDKEVVQKLKTETKSNPAADPFFHLLATRERSRSSITLGALSQRMKEEGFAYTRDQYRGLLKAMSTSGIAVAVVSRKGNITGVKDIKINLADLGKAACESKPSEGKVVNNKKESDKATTALPITKLEVTLNGRPAIIEFPKGASANDLASILEQLHVGQRAS